MHSASMRPGPKETTSRELRLAIKTRERCGASNRVCKEVERLVSGLAGAVDEVGHRLHGLPSSVAHRGA